MILQTKSHPVSMQLLIRSSHHKPRSDLMGLKTFSNFINVNCQLVILQLRAFLLASCNCIRELAWEYARFCEYADICGLCFLGPEVCESSSVGRISQWVLFGFPFFFSMLLCFLLFWHIFFVLAVWLFSITLLYFKLF